MAGLGGLVLIPLVLTPIVSSTYPQLSELDLPAPPTI